MRRISAAEQREEERTAPARFRPQHLEEDSVHPTQGPRIRPVRDWPAPAHQRTRTLAGPLLDPLVRIACTGAGATGHHTDLDAAWVTLPRGVDQAHRQDPVLAA